MLLIAKDRCSDVSTHCKPPPNKPWANTAPWLSTSNRSMPVGPNPQANRFSFPTGAVGGVAALLPAGGFATGGGGAGGGGGGGGWGGGRRGGGRIGRGRRGVAQRGVDRGLEADAVVVRNAEGADGGRAADNRARGHAAVELDHQGERGRRVGGQRGGPGRHRAAGAAGGRSTAAPAAGHGPGQQRGVGRQDIG